MEAELNGRLIKLDEDGELYWWYHRNSRNVLKNPRWIRFKQSLVKTKNKVYKTMEANGRKFKVHRVVYFIHNPEWNILDISKANLIDHVDRNTFNNNIENLRVVTQQQNQFNQKAKHIHLTKANTYYARVKCGEIKLDKVFKTEQEAINAVNEFKLKYHQF
jgi:hypothetical protein